MTLLEWIRSDPRRKAALYIVYLQVMLEQREKRRRRIPVRVCSWWKALLHGLGSIANPFGDR